ncbi:MAG: chromate transporter [Eubacteriales bacterium]|nr:chromate transporter [Eubacteriales bacterium]
MIYLQLFFSFMKIGFTSFGGMSMVPLILEEMQSHGWMTARDLANLVAIAEMTPGPLGVNCATFTGTQTAGTLGGLVAVLGVLTPAFTLTLVIAIFFEKFKDSAVMRTVMKFVKPVCIAMLLGVLVTLGKDTYFSDGGLLIFSILISAVMMVLLRKYKWSVPKVIGLSALMGILFYGVLPLAQTIY